jgi:hypothetical protein
MNKAKFLLYGILFCTSAICALASKAKFIDYFYWDGIRFLPINSPQNCHVTGQGCQTIINGEPTQLYKVLAGTITWVKDL